jgi:hypothetical protein
MNLSRVKRGPRQYGRDVHYDLCNSPQCPCYLEALEDTGFRKSEPDLDELQEEQMGEYPAMDLDWKLR